MIYADHAATTAMSRAALEILLRYSGELYGNPSALYTFGQRAKRVLEDARSETAALLHADAKELTFTSGGSESDNQALRSAAAIGAAAGRRHIVSTAFEHHAVLRTLEQLRREGFSVTLLRVPESGIVRAEQVAAAIRGDTYLVSVMFANNEIGTIQPVAEIGAVCRERGVLFHTDAVQAAGHLEIDVKSQNIDLLSLSAHKFHGPKGIGALYARRGIRLTPLICGGAQERGVRAGTENAPAAAAMAAALSECCAQLPQMQEKLTRQRDRLIEGLSAIPGSILNGDRLQRLPSNVNFSFPGIEGETLLLLLDQRGICASSGSACASGSAEPSHVLTAIGRDAETARGSLRLTIGRETTDAEIEALIAAVTECVTALRSLMHDRSDNT
ncbi:MAG: cysteine desulfurase [Oscillospiraceae bacterium]|nr:cysteine desulfurase [Oscillospiraceae bacterium]